MENNVHGSVLDIGKSKQFDYSGISYCYKSLDNNEKLNPDIVADICNNTVCQESFDTVLCNGMYECVEDSQKMVDEAFRLLKKGGKVIFGFVGKNYYPYKKDWKYYEEGKIKFNGKIIKKKDFNNYHFIVCQK